MNLRSPGATKLLGGLSLGLVAAAGWIFVLSPQTSALGEVQAQIQETKDQNDLLQLQLVVLQRQEKALPETRATADALAARFPPTADQPGLFRAVTAAAVDAGIPARDVTTLTPTPPVLGSATQTEGVQLPSESASPDLARQTVTLTVEGSYRGSQRLLANLEQMPRAYLVTSVTVTTGTDPGTFVTTVTGDMFVMPPPQRPEDAQPGDGPAEDGTPEDAGETAEPGDDRATTSLAEASPR
jgi:Tfp pilus assembly protein PilO